MLSLSRAWPALILGVIALNGCASTPDEPDPAQVKLNDIDERLGRVERVVNNQSLVALSQRLDALESQLRDLRGNVEELQNNGETLRKQQRDLYADLDRRISALEAALKNGTIAGPAGGTGLAAAPGAAAGAASADQAAYNHAFEALKAADYSAAIAQFRDFLRL